MTDMQGSGETTPPQVVVVEKRGLSAGWIVAIIVGALFLLMIPCAGLLIGIMLPALGKARVAAQQMASQAQMRGIYQGMVLYEQDHPDAVPTTDAAWRDALIDGGLIPAEMFVPPRTDGDGEDYVILPGAFGGSFDSGSGSRIVIYEDPDHHPDGVLVVFADGHAELVPRDAFERLLAASAATEPASP